MSLEDRLRVLPPGKEVPLDQIARKMGWVTDEAERQILALLKQDPSIGHLDVFSGVFVRHAEPSPAPGPVPLGPENLAKPGGDQDLTQLIAQLNQSFTDWEAVQAIDDAVAKATAAEKVVQSTQDILKALGQLGGVVAGKAWEAIDVSHITATDRDQLRHALALLATKKSGALTSISEGVTWFRAGVVAEKLGWQKEAEIFYNTAVERDPMHALAWNNLGTMRQDLGNTAGAVEAFQRAVAIQPRNSVMWANLGTTNLLRKNYLEAQSALERAVEVNPSDDFAWANLGVAYKEQGNLEPAVVAYERALILNPRDAGTWGNLAAAYTKQKRLEEALYCRERAASLGDKQVQKWITTARDGGLKPRTPAFCDQKKSPGK